MGLKTPLDAFTLYPQYFDYVARYDGNTYYNDTQESYSSAGASFILLNDAGDQLLLGKRAPRRSVYLDIDIPSGTPGTLTVSYSKAGGERGEVVGLDDTTNKLRQDGSISWNRALIAPTWTKETINGQTLYWIQISLSSLLGTKPTAKLLTTFGENRFSLYAGASDVSPTFTIDSNGRV